jgi:tetratricopeptide (TPR) repeat protein
MGAEVIAEELKQSSLERARILLEAVRADKGGPPLLRFDLGTVYELLDRHERAAEVLEAALREAPDHPAATDAYRYLAYACAKLGRSEAERDAYRAFLGRETDDRSRAVALLNLAEAHMHLGELDEAIAGYRDAMRVAAAIPYLPSVDETGVLAAWGLAVAQHRAGDVASSLDSARIALQRDGKEALLRNRDRVFFVPDYEEEWYFAVAAMARARSSVDAALAEKHWAAAAAAFGRYASRATQGRRRADPATEDRWLGAARAHERTCEQERARAARAMRRTKAARSPEPVP